jgi:hypothetical protein
MGLGGAAGWLASVGVRFLATAMHVLTSGVVGLGWGWAWRRRWWALPLCYVAAVAFHGLWNLNIVMALGGLGMAGSQQGLGAVSVVVAIFVQIMLVLVMLMALAVIPLALRKAADGSS